MLGGNYLFKIIIHFECVNNNKKKKEEELIDHCLLLAVSYY